MLIDVIGLEQSMSSSDTIFPHEDRDQSHTFVPESAVVARSNQTMDEDSLQEMIKKLNRKLHQHYMAITDEKRRILQSSPGSSGYLPTMPPVYSTKSKEVMESGAKGSHDMWSDDSRDIESFEASFPQHSESCPSLSWCLCLLAAIGCIIAFMLVVAWLLPETSTMTIYLSE
ncbi:hypothetical protein BDV41DRAFT_524793 [Aspergillus transmontanensis]|uniref:Uncharacterized protein n=1 Tax=Aspergillus transmontanensis TaxID=1034304 RepID=A0A5N6WAP2_9EURO|nr:hypothetical protein BDV41DRAFT_524793 [Aspergillus transmontanensis]